MLTSRLNLPIPGGWTKDVSASSPSAQENQNRELAAGIVGERGRVFDASGKPVAKVVEGESSDLVGSIVSSTGDILSSTGSVVGKAEILSEDDDQEQQPEDKEKVEQLIEKAKTESEVGSTKAGDATSDVEETGSQSSKGVKFADETETLGEKADEKPDDKVDDKLAEVEPEPIKDDDDDVPSDKTQSDVSKGDITPPSDQSDEKAAPSVTSEKPAEASKEATSSVISEKPTASETSEKPAASETSQKPAASETSEKPAVSETSEKPTETGLDNLDETSQKTAPSETTEKPSSDVGDKPSEAVTDAGSISPSDSATNAKPGVAASDVPTDAPTDAATDAVEGEGKKLDFSLLKGGKVNKGGNVVDESGSVVGHVIEGSIKSLIGRKPDENGDIWNDSGKVIGRVEPNEVVEEEEESGPFEDFPDAVVETDGTVTFEGKLVGRVVEGDVKKLAGKKVDKDGDILDRSGNTIGKAERWEGDEPEPEAEPEKVDLSALKGAKVNKLGNVVDDRGRVVGHIVEGALKNLVGRKIDDNGEIWNDSGKVIGRAEPSDPEETKEPSPFEDFPDAVVESDGTVTFEGKLIGRVIEGDAKKLKGKKVDEDGDILDRAGNVIGKAERWEGDEPEPEPEPEKVDFSALKDAKVNKLGNVVDHRGRVVGHVIEGALRHLIGRKTDENGEIWNDAGKVIGKAEPVDPEDVKEPSPFEDFPDAIVGPKGIVTSNGETVGRLIEGDAKKLKGKKVDPDGEILDSSGNVLGKAERWEEEEPEPEPEKIIDRSALAGKRVNKLGNVVDTSGTIFGRLVEGDAKGLAGRMCDKEGNVRSEAGDIIGRAELVPEGEREGLKEGPFAELPGCTVTKEGKVVTPGGDVVGRLIKGDAKTLFGRSVDEDGDVLDRNGNSLGKAERWEEPEVEKTKNPLEGRKVNREGNVVDTDGNIIGKLTSGELSICSGKEIDSDGDVVDSKGRTIGHASLLEDIPPEPEPEPVETESPEEKQKREEDEKDKKLAKQMAACLTQCLDRIKPICKMITQKIEAAERTPKEDLDEEGLVKEVKPLIEEGHAILQEANGIIRGLDPDGHIQANAKHKSATRDASPEEFHLADVLKELTGTVTECIDNAKRKIEGMPHAKKELNPLWGLLTEPLFQILAAVGLLLNGVLELVGRLLSGLGLGGLVNNILGGLGLTNVLKGLGIGGVVDALTGKTRNGKKKE